MTRKELEAEIERLRDWIEIVREDAISIACLAEEDTSENIGRLIINRLGQALKGTRSDSKLTQAKTTSIRRRCISVGTGETIVCNVW